MGKIGSQYLGELERSYPDLRIRAWPTSLSDRERNVLMRRLNGETLREVGKHLRRSQMFCENPGGIGLSKERTRQIEHRACRKLRWLLAREK